MSEAFYGEWQDGDNDPNLGHRPSVDATIELNSLDPVSDTNLTDSNTQVTRKKSERMSVKFARMRSLGNHRRVVEHPVEEGEDDGIQPPAYTNVLRFIKVVSLLVIGACALVGMVFSKITFVSITGRMYTLYNSTRANEQNNPKSVIFFQLVFILVIPEIVCLLHCIVWGFIGKTSKSFPWPSLKSLILGFISSVAEVIALCGFVFGVACKLPPSLTILLLSGVFWVVIARHFFWDIFYKRVNRRLTEYGDIDEFSLSACSLFLKRKLVPFLEFIGCLMQLGALIAIPILLALTESGYDNFDRFISLYILIPVTLTIISLVWSGWIQNYLVEPRVNITELGEVCIARLKSGMINSFCKIVIIPFVAYGYAVLLLDFDVTFNAENFRWAGLELSTFLTHVIVSFLAYLFLWMACALQSWAFFIPMLLSTPVSFVWYVGSAEVNPVFPFVNVYFVDWNLRYIVLVVASLLWISQILAFGYHVFQSSDNVLTSDANLFWTPRYNGVFLEQHILLNRKIDINGHYERQQPSDRDPYRLKKIAKDSHIFICSTMYHENEVEMKQMLKSINRVATASATESAEHHKYESHIFFDNALSGEHLSQWVMQLLGLLKDTLGIQPAKVTKLFTPYGMQLRYTLRGNMPFYIHLKDNSKVKNKKRWSQVMYMNYVLNYRIKHSEIPKDKAFILTTDADIDFTSDDVVALLDFLARDDGVGAVCARTHPLGSGPVVWYQIFDYAVGHWFQKAAEHVLGCVLCCPGCFSAFRVSAIEEVLSTYSSSAENGFDFLTKDMGEDRWLCTLLIQAGWRLEYAAVSQDSTFCPETFEEFYKQRRRWIPSTVANLALVISSYNKITANNDSISIMFILYQFLLVFSTLISPATVILIIVTGLTSLNENLDDVALIVVLCVISVLYGVVCVYATEKTQIDVAKLLTLIFAIIMGVVVSGILTDAISSAIEGDPVDTSRRNGTDTFRFPVDVTAVYLGIFSATFIVAGIVHLNEFMCLFHFIWYLLCLPSGYLLLTIYSASNINNRSWGTREGASPKSGGKSDSWLEYFLGKWHIFLGFFWKCIGWKPRSKNEEPPPLPPAKKEHIVSGLIPEPRLSKDVEDWLADIECEMYAPNFEREGYTELDFIATMKMADIVAIGVDKRGFQLKLEKEIKKLDTPEVSSEVPDNVMVWLDNIKLGQYKALFKSEGYSTDEDVENLKGLKRKDLESIGITRRAHLNQLLTRLRYLQYPTDIEIQTNKTRKLVEKSLTLHLSEVAREDIDKDLEYKFWHDLAERVLKPESANLGKVEELKQKLLDLRNIALLVLLLINIMWIVFLYTLVFPQLTQYNLPERAFSLLFLAIFSVIIIIQAVAMMFHRFITLVHLLARTKLKNKRLEANWFQPSGVDTISRAHY